MNRLFTLLLVLFCTISVFGQVQKEVKKNLDNRDFVAFKKYTDGLSNDKENIKSYWESFRDVTDEFKEGVFIFEKSVPHKDEPAISTVYTFRVKLITTDTQIAFYELSEKKHKKMGNHWEPYYKPLYKFKDEKRYRSLENSFTKIFQTELNENELFLTNIVYGERCGMVGQDPEERQLINIWVKNKNKIELLKWLKSPNTEKQIYAVDGLHQLNKTGTILTDEEMKMLNFVINKSGKIFVCSGCIHWQKEISEITEKFIF